MKSKTRHNIWKGMAAGLAGGLAATAVMSQFQAISQRWKRPEPEEAPEHPQPDSEPATVKAAAALAHGAGLELSPRAKGPAGTAVHYAFGAANGVFYGALSEYTGRIQAGRGMAFGTGLWALADEVAVPAFGLSRPPGDFRLSTHLYALASHLVYGFTADAVWRAVRPRL